MPQLLRLVRLGLGYNRSMLLRGPLLLATGCLFATGCDFVFGLAEVHRDDAGASDARDVDAKELGVVDVTAGGGTKKAYDLSTDQLVLDFQTTCADSTYVIVPRASFSVTAKIWGAGAGAGYSGDSATATFGGGGGYATATIDLDAHATYTAVVGQGGVNGSVTLLARCGGGGGVGASTPPAGTDWGASGGGYGGLFAGTVDPTHALLIAGGGGGATGDPEPGGAGGGDTGVQVTVQAGRGGGGGTQTAGGAGGTGNGITGSAGTALTGGNSNAGADGGGGGGWFGGGAGGSGNGGAGGGGAGYCATTVQGCNHADAPVAGAAGTPANAADPDRGTAGSGTSTLTTAGGSARIVLRLVP